MINILILGCKVHTISSLCGINWRKLCDLELIKLKTFSTIINFLFLGSPSLGIGLTMLRFKPFRNFSETCTAYYQTQSKQPGCWKDNISPNTCKADRLLHPWCTRGPFCRSFLLDFITTDPKKLNTSSIQFFHFL